MGSADGLGLAPVNPAGELPEGNPDSVVPQPASASARAATALRVDTAARFAGRSRWGLTSSSPGLRPTTLASVAQPIRKGNVGGYE